MKWITLLIYLAYYAMADDEVLVLTDKNFDETVNGDKPVLVKFYAPWCGHCKALAPEYIKLAEEVKKNDLPYIIAELDATEHREAASKNQIRGYPTIKLFIDGLAINYEKERKIDAMLDFIKKKMEPSSVELKSLEELKKKTEEQGRRCILVSDNEKDIKNYMNTGKLVEEFKFYHVSEKLGKELFTEIDKPSVVVLSDFGEKQIIYKESLDPKNLEAFLRKHQFDIVSALDDESAKVVFNKAEKKAVLLIASDKVEEEITKMFRELAEKRNSDKYMFLISKSDNSWGKRYLEFFGIEESDTPLIEIVDGRGRMSRYRHEGKLTVDEIDNFMNEFEAGKIPKFIKSEPIPEDNPGPVYKVVAKNFKDEVINNDMDVLVKFYAPWCGHCKALEPIYKSVAETLKENKSLKLVEVDATKNEIEGVDINSYPTLYFYPAGKKSSSKKFEGERTQEGLTKFLEENCVHKLDTKKSDL